MGICSLQLKAFFVLTFLDWKPTLFDTVVLGMVGLNLN